MSSRSYYYDSIVHETIRCLICERKYRQKQLFYIDPNIQFGVCDYCVPLTLGRLLPPMAENKLNRAVNDKNKWLQTIVECVKITVNKQDLTIQTHTNMMIVVGKPNFLPHIEDGTYTGEKFVQLANQPLFKEIKEEVACCIIV